MNDANRKDVIIGELLALMVSFRLQVVFSQSSFVNKKHVTANVHRNVQDYDANRPCFRVSEGSIDHSFRLCKSDSTPYTD